MTRLHVSLLQTHLAWELPEQNRAHFDALLENVPATSDLIVLPEMYSTGFSMASRRLAEPPAGESVAWQIQAAARHGACIVGSLITIEDDQYFNRFVAAMPNGEVVTYDKRHLFRMGAENDNYSAGHKRKIFNYKGLRILPQVCYDLRFPVFSRNVDDYDLALYVANWPAPRRQHWRTLLAARAIENQAYVVGCNRIGTDGNDVAYAGDSLAVDFRGEHLVDAEDHEGVFNATLDLEALESYRQEFPAWRDRDGFTLFPAE